ncbi:unnamed protein product [Allacma fusca]|uniref:C2H2-type domain-containing protein n=1 Tax=Allacma fusca TaxID=39272 RepID=A0A8J2PWV4_9HEXA|nr:unnamed protein product [Allacma fusca]
MHNRNNGKTTEKMRFSGVVTSTVAFRNQRYQISVTLDKLFIIFQELVRNSFVKNSSEEIGDSIIERTMELSFSEFKLALHTGGNPEEVGDQEMDSVSTVIINIDGGGLTEGKDLQQVRKLDEAESAECVLEEGVVGRNYQLLENILLEEKAKAEPEIMEAPEEVVATSKYPLLEKLLDSSEKVPAVGCEFKLFDEALKEFSDANYTATTNMLLNYDPSKYMAVPIDDRNNERNSSLLPISIIGYNYIDINRACVKPAEAPQSSEPKDGKTVVLQCEETMPAETSDENSGFQSRGPYNCTICLQKFFTKEYLHCHMIKSHNIKVASNSSKFLGYVSQIDGKSLVSLQKVDDASLQNQRFRCLSCPKSYTYIRNLKKHEKAVHNAVGNSNKCISQSDLNCMRMFSYQCRICQQQFLNEAALTLHSKLHASTCQVCYKVFGTRRGLKLHCAIHFGNQGKQFGCQFCDKRYSHARSLKHHMKQHGGSESMMEAQPQVQPEEREADGGGTVPLPPFMFEEPELDVISYTFGAVEETQ